MLTRKRCCCEPGCKPCAIPEADLSLTWKDTSSGATGGGVLAYAGDGAHDPYRRTFDASSGDWDLFTLGCEGGTIGVLWQQVVGFVTQRSCLLTYGGGDDSTCSPFHIHFKVSTHAAGGAGCTFMTGPFGYSDLWIDA